jgi:cbb3-type cytochrome oxidase subunit 1
MNISRNFLVAGSVYLIAGILLGSYMGGSGDHSLAPVHAHINLLGFTLMTVFGLAYRLMPQLAQGWMAKAHFWLHQVGALALLTGLALMMTETVDAATIGPLFPVMEVAILLGALIWLVNLVRNA